MNDNIPVPIKIVFDEVEGNPINTYFVINKHLISKIFNLKSL